MPDSIVIEDYHLTVIAPNDLPKQEYTAIIRTLRGKSFLIRLNTAVAEVLRRYPSLKNVTFCIEPCRSPKF